ncbi:MAG: fibronectin type III domain-containing protein, partial [Lachnospiraceae bacterium]
DQTMTASEFEGLSLVGKQLKAAKISGFEVTLEDGVDSATITLSQNQKPGFTAEKAAAIRDVRTNEDADDPVYGKYDPTYNANNTNTTYKESVTKAVAYAEGYNPTDYWLNYHNSWTVTVTENGFVPLTAFERPEGIGSNIDLTYLNQAELAGIASIKPVTTVTDVKAVSTTAWGDAGTVVKWQAPVGKGYDSFEITYTDADGAAQTITTDASKTNQYLANIANDADVTVKVISGDTKSAGVTTKAVVDKQSFLIDDFELGELNNGLNWIEGQDVESATNFNFAENRTASIGTLYEDEDNKYMGVEVQAVEGNHVKGVIANLPEGASLAEDTSKFQFKVKMVDSQHYTPLPTNDTDKENAFAVALLYKDANGKVTKSNVVKLGLDLEAEYNWEDISIPMSSFPSVKAEQVVGIQIGSCLGRRNSAFLLDDINFTSEPDYTVYSYEATKNDSDELVVTWTAPSAEFDSYRLSVRKEGSDDYNYVNPVTLENTATTYNFGKLRKGSTYEVKLEVVKAGETKFTKSVFLGFFDAGEEKTYEITKDTSYSNATTIQNSQLIMLGRGRVAMLQFDMEELGNIAEAKLQLSAWRGASTGFSVFLMPNNEWTPDSSDFVPSKYKPVADADQTLSSYNLFDSTMLPVFPDRGEKPSGNDTTPSAADEEKALKSAGKGTLKDFFYGDYCTGGNYQGVDVTNTLAAAKRMGNTTVTLLLVTPYTFASTLDLYAADSADISGYTVEKNPKVSISYAKEYTLLLGDVNEDGFVTAVDALLALNYSTVAGHTGQELEIADVNGDGDITADDVQNILQFATGEIAEFPSVTA